ncbi:MAG: ATP-binding protein [Acidimicrobiia bacterium]
MRPLSDLDMKVQVPPRPEFVHLLRSVATSAAAQLDKTYDEISDLTLAVDEAAAELLAAGGQPVELGMELTAEDGSLRVTVWSDGSPDHWPPPTYTERLSWQVLMALTDQLEYSNRGPQPQVSFLARSRA